MPSRISLDTLLDRPLPRPPDALRRGPFRRATGDDDAEPRPPHDPRTARLIGTAAGTCLLICFVTGLISHLHQHPVSWFDLPSRPVWGYRVSQGLHVACGIAAVPLVLVKLWVVFPRLFSWPPVRTIGHGLERALVAPLVAGVLFELTTGLLNVVQWYPWRFGFVQTHWAVAWVMVGALLVHLAVKLPRSVKLPHSVVIKKFVMVENPDHDEQRATARSSDRRTVLIGAATAVGAVTVATVGQSVTPLSGLSVLAPRRPGPGPARVPVNRTAAAAGVVEQAADPGWRLVVAGPRSLDLSMADLQRLPQYQARLPIACVEGWSVDATWTGVRLRDVLDLAGIPATAHLRVVSLERHGGYAASPVAPPTANDPLTLLALRLDDRPLSLDHGYPLRLIAPNRPGVQQTKWLSRIELVTP
jgi:DMSO/TMAO reductase YedYZ molybdopterin-dependent catalytic subunit